LSKKWSVLGKIRVFWVFKVENRIFSMQNKVETTILWSLNDFMGIAGGF